MIAFRAEIPQKWYRKIPSVGDSPCLSHAVQSGWRGPEGYGRAPRRRTLQRLFSSFPSGWPGFGLFLLRTAVGMTAVIQGGVYLSGRVGQTFEIWVVGWAMLASGV